MFPLFSMLLHGGSSRKTRGKDDTPFRGPGSRSARYQSLAEHKASLHGQWHLVDRAVPGAQRRGSVSLAGCLWEAPGSLSRTPYIYVSGKSPAFEWMEEK